MGTPRLSIACRLRRGLLQAAVLAGAVLSAGLAAAQKLSSRGDIPARAHFVAVVTEHGLMDEIGRVPGLLQTVDARVDELLRVLAVRGE